MIPQLSILTPDGRSFSPPEGATICIKAQMEVLSGSLSGLCSLGSITGSQPCCGYFIWAATKLGEGWRSGERARQMKANLKSSPTAHTFLYGCV